MKRVTDGNGFLRYHHAKRSRREVERPADVGLFVEVMLPEIRACLYRAASLEVAGRLAQTCKVLCLELTAPNTGWIWLPAQWRSLLATYAAHAGGTALCRIFQEELRPRRFFERVRHAATIVEIRHISHIGYDQIIHGGVDLGGTWRFKGVPGGTGLAFFYGRVDAADDWRFVAPEAAELQAWIDDMAQRGDAKATAARQRPKVPAKLRHARAAATKQRSELRKRAFDASRTVWLGLKNHEARGKEAAELAVVVAAIAQCDETMAAINAEIAALNTEIAAPQPQ